METQLVPYDIEEATITALQTKYSDITILPDDKAAYAMVMSGLRECRDIRLACDEWHKTNKAWILKAGKHYDAEKRRVHGLIEPIESSLKSARQAEDDRIEAIKQEKIRKEEVRVQNIREKIDAIRGFSNIPQTMPAARIEELMTELITVLIDDETFQEFADEAQAAKIEASNILFQMKQAREKFEQEQAAAKAEAERLEKIRKEQEVATAKIKAEQEAIEIEKRKLQEEKDRIEREKREEQERIDRTEFERKAKEEAKIQADKDAKEAVERKAKEKEEKERREAEKKAKKEARRPDKEKFEIWVQSHGQIVTPVFNDQSICDLASWFESNVGTLIDEAITKAEDIQND